MTGESSLPKRLLELSPVLAAMVFHAVTVERWLLVIPTGLVLIAAGLSNVAARGSMRGSMRAALVAVVIGLTAGVAMMLTSVPPPGPLPPLLTCAITGALLGLDTFFAICRRIHAASICSWILVALSANAESSPSANLALIVFLAASLVGAASMARVFNAGPRVIAAMGLFLVLVASATLGFSAVAKRLDGIVLGAIERFFDTGNLPKVTGIGDEILLGARSSISISMRPLLELSAESGRMRVQVMDRFDGQRWSTSTEMESVVYTLAEAPVYRDAMRELEMLLLDDPGVKLPSPAGIWDVRGAEAYFQGGWVLRGKAQGSTIGLVGDKLERLPTEATPAAHLLEVSDELRTGLASLTEKLVRDAETPLAKAEAVEQFFQENFEYSLDTNLMGPAHPLIQLVHQRRPAYCVYFASAMAVMLRMEGIPSRIVSGYVPGETNPLTGRVIIRRRDSHAWVEAWLPDEQRFVAFDPTPGRSREQVIGTVRSPGRASALFGAIGSLVRRAWLTSRNDLSRVLVSVTRSPISWVFVLISFILLLRRRSMARQASATISTRDSINNELHRIYQRYLSSLRQSGLTPLPAETDDELIERLSDQGDYEKAVKARDFIARYRRARYRGETIQESLIELAQLK